MSKLSKKEASLIYLVLTVFVLVGILVNWRTAFIALLVYIALNQIRKLIK